MRLSDPSVDPVSDEEIATGERAAAYVNDLIQGPALPERARSWQENVALGTLRLARMRRFLERVGNPHAGLRIVHVGGTSGKGSVAAKVAAGLTAAGYRTGLHVSPYLQTPLEKFVLDGRLGRPRELVDLVAWIRPHVDAFARADRDGAPTYGMVWVALTFEYFRRAATDVLVLEVGAGGRFDLTNVVHPVLAVVTAVGLDHTKTLGDRLEDIAWHKAGIYKSGVPAMAGATPPEALAVLTREAERVGAPFEHAGLTAGPDVRVANTALALAALARLRSCGFARLRPAALAAAAEATLPGRFERMPGLPATVLDGAHNRDKAQALARL
ncbi:MAG: bifunctional folylpolyglutamate synthase/dihydrofolate synthase, partial [Actinobacteria bacterium]|nr:bifunctional folylpolyglutamate synthase/dihydrofolate synthase [Actinomycetota bacterium]